MNIDKKNSKYHTYGFIIQSFKSYKYVLNKQLFGAIIKLKVNEDI